MAKKEQETPEVEDTNEDVTVPGLTDTDQIQYHLDKDPNDPRKSVLINPDEQNIDINEPR